ncbi:MAG TPA: hypothetical protein VHB79_04485 [Polyangiaceae bacterium]|nr:hypothetical protein [Polyangiaceae bacterium]
MPLKSQRERAILASLVLAAALVRCTPDFDSLSSGQHDGAAAADGGESPAGSGAAGEGIAGSTTDTTTGGAGGVEGTGAAGAGSPAMAGATAGDGGGDGGEAGAGGAAVTCMWKPAGSTHYDGFDGGLEGIGFLTATTRPTTVTTHDAFATSAWDQAVGKTCPGSLHLQAEFDGYASGQEPDEIAIADLRFDDADWTGATKLHAWAKVSPMNAPLAGVRFFVMSGASFLYLDAFDEQSFLPGQWYELVLPLPPGPKYDPTLVRRLGVEIPLRRAGAADNPALPLTVDVWLDDVWVE